MTQTGVIIVEDMIRPISGQERHRVANNNINKGGTAPHSNIFLECSVPKITIVRHACNYTWQTNLKENRALPSVNLYAFHLVCP